MQLEWYPQQSQLPNAPLQFPRNTMISSVRALYSGCVDFNCHAVNSVNSVTPIDGELALPQCPRV